MKSNLTVTLKPGNIKSKSSSNPVYCRVGKIIKKVKLSKYFKNAGTIARGKGRPRKDLDSFVHVCDHAHSMNYYTGEGIIGSYNDKTKADTQCVFNQWMFRRCSTCGELQSAKLGKWKVSEKANRAWAFRPKQ